MCGTGIGCQGYPGTLVGKARHMARYAVLVVAVLKVGVWHGWVVLLHVASAYVYRMPTIPILRYVCTTCAPWHMVMTHHDDCICENRPLCTYF